MARLPRLTVAGYPHHIIQRGNNRQSIFNTPADYQMLLSLIAGHSQKFGVAVHSYVLMGNHFHLLLTPETNTGVPLTMQAVGRQYVRYFNDRLGRSGTLWEGRYRSTLIDSERYLLACMAYIDLNPERAGIAPDAASYLWSGYRHYAGLQVDPLITPHSLFWTLGNTPFAREIAYAQLVQAGIDAVQQQALTDSTLRGWALGAPDFVEGLKKSTERRVVKAVAGRPRLAKEG